MYAALPLSGVSFVSNRQTRPSRTHFVTIVSKLVDYPETEEAGSCFFKSASQRKSPLRLFQSDKEYEAFMKAKSKYPLGPLFWSWSVPPTIFLLLWHTRVN
jgi:hypothetical protein